MRKNKVLVTGADGFIGSHLVEALLETGAEVKAFCYYNSFNSLGWIDTFPKEKLSKIELFTGDVRDPNGMRIAVKGCDAVFHLAALIGIPYSYHSPDNYVDTNIKGTLNVLQAARDLGTARVFVTSTSEVYGTAKYTPIDEDHPLQPQSPYSATKIGADAIAKSFFNSFDLPITIVRPFNTYGPRQSARAVIPTVITQILSGMKEIRLGDLRPKRDLNYVKDTCSGFLAIAAIDKTIGETINISSGVEYNIGEVVTKIIDIIAPRSGIKIISDSDRIRPEKSEVMRLMGDNRKLITMTGWNPQYSIEKGLAATIEWFKENLGKYKPERYNV